MSCSTRGLLVTIPLPRGKKSLPTIFSSTDDFPDDCEPTTTWNMIQLQSTITRHLQGSYSLFGVDPESHYR